MPKEFTYFWNDTIRSGLREVLSFIERIVRYIISFIDSLPSLINATFYILLGFAVIGILMSNFLGIYKNLNIWKEKPNSDLMFSYFCGTGSLQCKLSYKEANKLLRDRKWLKFSVARLAYLLGNYTHASKILMFACSLLYLPIAILGFVEMVLRVVIGTIWLFAASLAQRLILFVLCGISYLLIPIWHIADKVVRIDQHCPHCYETFNLPGFKCPNCGIIHMPLLPSRCGILVARCTCGYFLPSSAFTGRSNLNSVCPVCNGDLVAANVKQFSIQLVGGNSSGKTAFLSAFQHLYLGKTINMNNLIISGEPQIDFEDLEKMYRTGMTEPSSATTGLTYSFLHKFKQTAKYNLVIFDIPDEVVLSGTYERIPRNLGFLDGIIFIVDPLSISAVREECLKSGKKHEVDKYSTDDINELIIEFVQQFSSINGQAVRRQIDIPVAIIINKADIKAVKREIGLPKIKATYGANPGSYGNDETVARDEICRAYLSKLGLDNALNNLDGSFSNICYFPVSAIGHVSESGKVFEPFGVTAPIVWIAKKAKSRLFGILNSVLEEGAK